MTAAIEGLERAVALAERLYATAETECRRRIEHDGSKWWKGAPLQPEDLIDTNGRPVLLDAVIALANARAALVTAEALGRVVLTAEQQ